MIGIGDWVYENLPDWKEGTHLIPESVGNMGQWSVKEIIHFKSDILYKGLNTIASFVKFIIAPISTLKTDSFWIEHHWIVLKVVDENEKERYLAIFKDFFGNIAVVNVPTLEIATHKASFTINNKLGEGVRVINSLNLNGELKVEAVIKKLKEIPAVYHLTLENCQHFSKLFFGFFGDQSNFPKCTPLTITPMIAPEEMPLPPTDRIPVRTNHNYTIGNERGLPYFREATLFKDGKPIGTVQKRHFPHAREGCKKLEAENKLLDEEAYQHELNEWRKKQEDYQQKLQLWKEKQNSSAAPEVAQEGQTILKLEKTTSVFSNVFDGVGKSALKAGVNSAAMSLIFDLLIGGYRTLYPPKDESEKGKSSTFYENVRASVIKAGGQAIAAATIASIEKIAFNVLRMNNKKVSPIAVVVASLIIFKLGFSFVKKEKPDWKKIAFEALFQGAFSYGISAISANSDRIKKIFFNE